MSKEQHAVLWLGFLLIITRALTSGTWSSVWGTLKNGSTTAATTTTPSNAASALRNPRAGNQNATAPVGSPIANSPTEARL
jgi:hypothetical protein